jgi:hypothetical protein
MNRNAWPPLIVTVGAVAATAHGGFTVATAVGVPGPVALLYPVITDGLALVAYIAARAGLHRWATAYAWVVVVLAAGLSGLAQAVNLQSGGKPDTAGMLGFGIGCWPAVAGLLAAHLVYIQRERDQQPGAVAEPAPSLDVAPIPVSPVVRAALDDTTRARLQRVARDRQASPADRAAAVAKLKLGRSLMAATLGIRPDQARKLIDNPDQAATLLAGFTGQEEATR